MGGTAGGRNCCWRWAWVGGCCGGSAVVFARAQLSVLSWNSLHVVTGMFRVMHPVKEGPSFCPGFSLMILHELARRLPYDSKYLLMEGARIHFLSFFPQVGMVVLMLSGWRPQQDVWRCYRSSRHQRSQSTRGLKQPTLLKNSWSPFGLCNGGLGTLKSVASISVGVSVMPSSASG